MNFHYLPRRTLQIGTWVRQKMLKLISIISNYSHRLSPLRLPLIETKPTSHSSVSYFHLKMYNVISVTLCTCFVMLYVLFLLLNLALSRSQSRSLLHNVCLVLFIDQVLLSKSDLYISWNGFFHSLESFEAKARMCGVCVCVWVCVGYVCV